uniref:Tetratricopeptide repeat protein 21B-like n=1 Tax=Sinocyclocheilus rhinocerous TaxID=307959 RepID=A0A673GB83_9TELE
MSENDKTCPLIIYYMREKYYRHAINTAVKNLKLYNNDPVLRFFKAFATLMEEFIQLRDHPYLSLCSTAALIYAHKRSETIGNSELCEPAELGAEAVWIRSR